MFFVDYFATMKGFCQILHVNTMKIYKAGNRKSFLGNEDKMWTVKVIHSE